MGIGIIIVRAVYILLDIIQFLILARCIFSWVPLNGNSSLSGINNILIFLTEPIIAPARNLLYRFPFTRNLPFDLSPWLAIVILAMLSQILVNVLSVLGI